MSAVHYILLYLRKLLEALRNPLNRSLRPLLQLWGLIKTLLSRRVHRKPNKTVQGRECNQDSTIIYPSHVPTLSPILGGDTPQIASPIPRLLLSSYDFPTGSSQDPDEENAGNNRLHIPDQQRPSSRASSRAPSVASGRNSHMGAEQSAIRGLTEPHIVLPSRSGSPMSVKSIKFPNSHLRPNDFSMHRLRQTAASPRAHSMVDLHARPYRLSISQPQASRARSSSPKPLSGSAPRSRSRSRSPIPFSGNLRRHSDRRHSDMPRPDASPRHFAADPGPVPSRPLSAVPIIPEIRPCVTVGRYDRNVRIDPDAEYKHVIPSLTRSFSHENLPTGWTPLAHPEGALYWVHDKRPIYTDAHLCDTNNESEINRFLEVIDLLMDQFEMPADWELVLELAKDEWTDERVWAYYFVDHETRALFWLHEHDADIIISDLRVVKSRAHIYQQLQSFYWTHWETFPHNREVPPELYQELMGILVHAGIDSLTSPVSTSVYSQADLHKLIGFIKLSKSIGGNYGYAACVTGRMMSFFANSRFVNYYGQECARLSRNQTVYERESRPRSALMLVSALLFFAPEVHLRGLEDIYVDWVVCAHMWSTFIGKLQTEWQEFVLYATVLLNANVAFLAIPSVDTGPYVRDASQIVSYISVIASIGSVITGLLLIRQHRSKKEVAFEVDAFLLRKTHPTRGLETLAIMYSLPYSLLMWAMISFLAAFLLECLVKPQDVLARIPVIIALVSVSALVLWCINTGWEREHPIRFPLMGLFRSWMDKLRWHPMPRSTQGNSAKQQNQNSWFCNVLPRRRSNSSSTAVGPSVEVPASRA